MKILYLTDVFPPHCGGSGWSVYFFARALRREGLHVDVVSLEGPSRYYDGFEVEGLQLPKLRLPFIDNWKRENITLRKIARLLQKRLAAYDLVHAHHRLSTVVAALAEPARFFVTVRDYWPVCICGRSLYRTGASCDLFDFSRCTKSLLAPLVYPWLAVMMETRRALLQKAESIFCISRYLLSQFLPYIPEEKMMVLPNFAEKIDATFDGNLPNQFLLYVGKLEENKGAHLLPEILRVTKTDLPLVVVGDGSLQQSLKSKRIYLLGYLEYPQMLSVLSRSTVLLFPSLWAEPLGRVLIEAGMMGKPVVAFSHAGGHLDILEHQNNAILANDIRQFAEAVDLLVGDKNRREKMGENAIHIYQQKFSPAAVVPQLLSRYLNHEQ